MSKGLEKLALIQKVFEKLADWNGYDLRRLDEDFETNFDLDFVEIEKELQALEIIKKSVIPLISLDYEKWKDRYCVYDNEGYQSNTITKEEYDLLKEVLK